MITHVIVALEIVAKLRNQAPALVSIACGRVPCSRGKAEVLAVLSIQTCLLTVGQAHVLAFNSFGRWMSPIGKNVPEHDIHEKAIVSSVLAAVAQRLSLIVHDEP